MRVSEYFNLDRSQPSLDFVDGDPVFISDPMPGNTHDAIAYEETPVKKIVEKSGGGIADKGYQGTGLITPRKKPKGGNSAGRTRNATGKYPYSAHPLNG